MKVLIPILLVRGKIVVLLWKEQAGYFYQYIYMEDAMSTNNKSLVRWLLIVWYLGILTIVLACVGIGVGGNPETGTPNSDEALIRLEDGVVEVQDENDDWTPVSGDSAFDVTAELESTDPWKVAGITLMTNESTQIEEGLQAGDLVRVRGVILEGGTWLANSIARAEEQIDPILILIGRVASVDPWVVNGIQLNVTEDTDIQGTITSGMFVRVEILLSTDGTWEVLSIAPLGDPEENPDCRRVVAVIIRVEGNEIQLSGWPPITLGEDVKIESDGGGEGTLGQDQVVIVVVCPSGEGQIVIVQIIIVANADEDGTSVEGEKVLVCHKPDKKGGHTLSISSSAVPAHLGHGDKLGPCP